MDKRNTAAILPLDGEWDFAYTRLAPDPEHAVFPGEEEYETRSPVPAYWDDCQDRMNFTKFWSRDCLINPDYRPPAFPIGLNPPDASLPTMIGTGWYHRTFTAEAAWADSCVTLQIGGVALEAWVWLNGEYIGHHLGHLTPFELELNRGLKPGEANELIIAVSNGRKDVLGCSIRGFKGKGGGITRSVCIRTAGKAGLGNCYVRTDQSLHSLYWEIGVRRSGYSIQTLSLDWAVTDGEEGAVSSELPVIACGTAASSDGDFTWTTETFGLKPWSDVSPRLYRLEFTLRDGSTILDHKEQAFGLRYAESREKALYLNYVPIFLRGITEHAYFPETCTVPTQRSYYRKAILSLKSMGYNWIRFHTWVPPEECLIEADRLGMLMQVEAPNGFTESEFLDILITCRRHPCVILYCCGNEVQIDDTMEEKLKRMSEHCHRLAPDCLYNPMSALFNIELRMDEKESGYTKNPVPHNAVRLARVEAFSDALSPWIGLFSYHSMFHDMDKLNGRFSIYHHPCMIHEAGINDSWLNLDLEHRYEGTRIGTSLYAAARAYMTKMGVVKNSPLYYLNSCRWMSLTAKFSLEKARLLSSVSGYDYLGGIDCHWHRTGYAVGMFNEFYEPKPGFAPEDVISYNGESVLLTNCTPHRNLQTGEAFSADIFVSLYGPNPIKRGLLSWYLEDENRRICARGGWEVRDVPNGSVTPLGTVHAVAPAVGGRGAHLKLRVRLSGEYTELTNHWDYWVYPNGTKKEEFSGIRVTDRLDRESLSYMSEGGRILLLGSGPFPALLTTFQLMTGGRVDGNCATVIYDHPLTRQFPQEGFCDWQFYSMLEGGEAVVFNNLDIPFDPILEVVSSYKLIRRQAGIFELAVGKGGLLVCALNMHNNEPGTVSLYNSMIRYLSSDEFRPKTAVTDRWLCSIMDSGYNTTPELAKIVYEDMGGQVHGSSDLYSQIR